MIVVMIEVSVHCGSVSSHSMSPPGWEGGVDTSVVPLFRYRQAGQTREERREETNESVCITVSCILFQDVKKYQVNSLTWNGVELNFLYQRCVFRI